MTSIIKRRVLVCLFLAALAVSLIAPLMNFNGLFVSASTSSFGYTTIGGSTAMIGGSIVGSNFSLPYTGVAESISAALSGGSTVNMNVKCAVYYAGNLSLVAMSEEVNVALTTSLAWKTFDFPTPPTLTGGIDYVLVAWTASTPYVVNLAYDAGATNQSYSQGIEYDGNFPDPLVPSYSDREYSIYVSYHIPVTLASSPEINAGTTFNGTSYDTGQTLNLAAGYYTVVADSAVIYNSSGYVFDHWLVNGTASYATESIGLEITGASTFTAYYNVSSNVYVFYGPFSESTGLALNENVTVTAHYSTATIPNDSFTLNGSYAFVPSGTVQYFSYLFSDNDTREYWVDPSETISTFYVFRDDDLTDYVINFLDYTGILDTYPYVTAKTYVNGSLFTVEKQKVDADNTFSMALLNGRKYQLIVGNENFNYVYGDLLMTASTSVQLVLRGVDFPKETLLMYPYLTLYGLRSFASPAGSIYIQYNDSKADTLNFTLTITDNLGTIAYSYTTVSNNVGLNWTSAVNATAYTVEVEIEHGVYGDYTWRQYFPAEGGSPVTFSLDFLGQWTFNSDYLLAIFLLLCVAGCVSALNAEVGAVAAAIMGVALSYMGWLPIPMGLLVTALALAILMALIYNKRRIQIGY